MKKLLTVLALAFACSTAAFAQFEKGKKYLVSYEVDRGHFLQADWTAALKIEEIK